jgi:hypothetical protein
MNRHTTESQIRQAVFLSLMKDLAQGSGSNQLFFLVLEPNEEDTLKTSYTGFRVRSARECTVDQQQGPKAKDTGEIGLLLEIKQIEIKGETADVFAGYFSGAGVLYSFRLEKRAGAWMVVKKRQKVVS